ncbi:cathelicidin-3-like isoform X1 [Balearica regulorum gibbericeps]|uniref:cathelicidin-3-like isoform X1 n=1 Tax=Balearica regulorum gibbericeps TaxID=100784 RepID=UPI003F637F91
MPSSWALVLAVLGGACALPAPAPLAYTQALAQAVDSYNQRPEVQNVFRLLSADPEPTPDIQLSSLQHLNFTVMETRCPARSGTRPDTCEFKEDGVRAEGGGSWRGGGVSRASRGVPSLGTVPPPCVPAQHPPCPQLIKDCSAPAPQPGSRPVLDVTCVDSTTDPVRVKRFWPLVKVAINAVAAGINLFKAIKGK